MTVYLVGAGPGDPDLLTLRAHRLLGRADVVIVDRLVDPRVLELVAPGATVIDVGKHPRDGRASVSQDEINQLLIAEGSSGATVIRLKGGDPFVFGRGGEELVALSAAGIDVEVVPGLTSALSVPLLAGIPVTHRGAATSVTIVTGHGGTDGSVDWAALAKAGGTLSIVMGVARRAEIAEALIEGGRPGSTPVVVLHAGATPTEQRWRTTLDQLGNLEVAAPAVFVVGEVAGLELA